MTTAAAGTFVQLDPGAPWHRVAGRSSRETTCGLRVKGGSDWFDTDTLPAYRVAPCCAEPVAPHAHRPPDGPLDQVAACRFCGVSIRYVRTPDAFTPGVWEIVR